MLPQLARALGAPRIEHDDAPAARASIDRAAGLAADVMALETALAGLTKSGVERRDVSGMYNPTDLAGLAALALGRIGRPGAELQQAGLKRVRGVGRC